MGQKMLSFSGVSEKCVSNMSVFRAGISVTGGHTSVVTFKTCTTTTLLLSTGQNCS
jgi:hypothetical protein